MSLRTPRVSVGCRWPLIPFTPFAPRAESTARRATGRRSAQRGPLWRRMLERCRHFGHKRATGALRRQARASAALPPPALKTRLEVNRAIV